jgi:hypothetical protein
MDGGGMVGGNGSVEWEIKHSTGGGHQHQIDPVPALSMRKDPDTGAPSFKVTLRNAKQTAPGVFEVPVIVRGAGSKWPPDDLEIRIEW